MRKLNDLWHSYNKNKTSVFLISVDCVWGPWQTSPCSASCGNATKVMTRSIQRNESNGGKPCEGAAEKIVDCKYRKCPGKMK